jgi:hypothetical protein
MHMPPGYREGGQILWLNKALFGLRRSLLLWQKKLITTLIALGFEPVLHKLCCLTKNSILVFFYVDNIVFVYQKDCKKEATELIQKLDSQYKLLGGRELQWFLSINILCNHANKQIWLSQALYMEKISHLAETSPPGQTLMARILELLPNPNLATPCEINWYQQKIRSLLYAIVNTWPDIAYIMLCLACFLMNPSLIY